MTSFEGSSLWIQVLGILATFTAVLAAIFGEAFRRRAEDTPTSDQVRPEATAQRMRITREVRDPIR